MESEEIKNAVKTALIEFQLEQETKGKEFNIPMSQHYLDHQWISSVRSDGNKARAASVIMIATFLITFIGGSIWLAIKEALSK